MSRESCIKLINDLIKETENEIFLRKSQCSIKGFNINKEIDSKLKKLNTRKYVLYETRDFIIERKN